MQLIVVIVERGKGEKVATAARAAGSTGATTLYGRGAPEREIRKFLSLAIESAKEVVLILAYENQVETLLEAVREAGHLDQPGKGIAFTLPVSSVLGLKRED